MQKVNKMLSKKDLNLKAHPIWQNSYLPSNKPDKCFAYTCRYHQLTCTRLVERKLTPSLTHHRAYGKLDSKITIIEFKDSVSANGSTDWRVMKTHPKCLLENSEWFSCLLSLHRYLIMFLQHLLKKILPVTVRNRNPGLTYMTSIQ
jgi:hypothetical protein